MEYPITGMKCVTIKYCQQIVIIHDFKGEMVDLFAPKRFNSKTTDLAKKLKN